MRVLQSAARPIPKPGNANAIRAKRRQPAPPFGSDEFIWLWGWGILLEGRWREEGVRWGWFCQLSEQMPKTALTACTHDVSYASFIEFSQSFRHFRLIDSISLEASQLWERADTLSTVLKPNTKRITTADAYFHRAAFSLMRFAVIGWKVKMPSRVLNIIGWFQGDLLHLISSRLNDFTAH
jgi:hypothetical protein